MENKTGERVRKYGFRFKKALGQNFLKDRNVVEDIIEGSGITENTRVLEIGPGVGSLTEAMLEKAESVTAVELDANLIPILEEEFKDRENFRLLYGDILKMDIGEIMGDKEFITVANLPYYVTTPIIIKLLEEDSNLRSLTVMVQKEVAERLTAKPGTKDYGSLTLLTEYYTKAEIVRIVPPECFIPAPKVESAVIRLDIREVPPVTVKDTDFMMRVIKESFAMRRKTIANNLKKIAGSPENLRSALQKASIDPGRRGETLSLSEFALLSDALLEGLK